MDNVTENAKTMYDEFRFGEFSYGQAREKHNPLLLEFIRMIESGKSLCDIGCGAGFWIDAYQRYGIEKSLITAVDLSPTNVANLSQRGIRAICGNAMSLPLTDSTCDYTVCNGVIHHTDDPFRAFCELVRITRPGGAIFLNVYNKFHPYYHLVHKATFPIRYAYWHWNKRIVDFVLPPARILFQPLAFLVFGKFLDNRTARTLFMDQVITPRAELFSKADIRSYASRCNCIVERFRYNKYYLLISAILKVN